MSSQRQSANLDRFDGRTRDRNVIIVGASVRAAAESLRRAGLSPWCIDLFADTDLIEIAPTLAVARLDRQLVRLLARLPLAPWMYTGGLENRPRLVTRLSQLRPLLGNPASVLQAVRSLDQLRPVVESVGAPIPPYQVELSADQAQAAAAERDRLLNESDGEHDRPDWIWKPWRSAGGLRIVSRSDFTVRWSGARVASIPSAARGAQGYWQRYIPGRPCGATFVADGRKGLLLGVCEQLSGPTWPESPQFLYGGSIGPLPLCKSRRDQLERLGAAVVERFGLVGLFGIDLIDAGERLWTLEVNPRYAASMELFERASGISLAALHLAACRGAFQEVERDVRGIRIALVSECVHGKAIWYARESGQVTVAMFERLSRLRAARPWSSAADIPAIGSPLNPGVPIATIFAEGVTADEVRKRLLDHLAALRRDCARISSV